MNARFERSGPLTELSSYPQWAQDMVGECDVVKKTVVDHDLWREMCSGRDPEITPRFVIGAWPAIERFPCYMARTLLKTRYGRSAGEDLARRWLVRNIRVEQNHAEYWLQWAAGAGVPREQILQGLVPAGSQTLADWCEEISTRGSLAASLAAVNYGVEGATGEWSRILWESESFAAQYPEHGRRAALRWLQLHAVYDDTHPWEALELVCTLLGAAPKAAEVDHIGECIKRTYVAMRILGDRSMQPITPLESGRMYQTAAA
jgi:pyrroloquinoline quinone (PQQ) biosynthesis protein C